MSPNNVSITMTRWNFRSGFRRVQSLPLIRSPPVSARSQSITPRSRQTNGQKNGPSCRQIATLTVQGWQVCVVMLNLTLKTVNLSNIISRQAARSEWRAAARTGRAAVGPGGARRARRGPCGAERISRVIARDHTNSHQCDELVEQTHKRGSRGGSEGRREGGGEGSEGGREKGRGSHATRPSRNSSASINQPQTTHPLSSASIHSSLTPLPRFACAAPMPSRRKEFYKSENVSRIINLTEK
jgi:hypothetical protein